MSGYSLLHMSGVLSSSYEWRIHAENSDPVEVLDQFERLREYRVSSIVSVSHPSLHTSDRSDA